MNIVACLKKKVAKWHCFFENIVSMVFCSSHLSFKKHIITVNMVFLNLAMSCVLKSHRLLQSLARTHYDKAQKKSMQSVYLGGIPKK